MMMNEDDDGGGDGDGDAEDDVDEADEEGVDEEGCSVVEQAITKVDLLPLSSDEALEAKSALKKVMTVSLIFLLHI